MIFVPVVNVVSMIVILFLISVYDFIAVWKTKHMIRLAKFQAKMKLFAGLQDDLYEYGPLLYENGMDCAEAL